MAPESPHFPDAPDAFAPGAQADARDAFAPGAQADARDAFAPGAQADARDAFAPGGPVSLLGRPSSGAVVTGGASGIGRAACFALAAVGRPVAVWDRDGEGAATVAGECARLYGVRTSALELDVADTAAIEAGVAPCVAALGSVGALVHAAGIGGPGPVDMVDDALWDSVLDVNLRAAAMLTRAFLPTLVAANPGSAVVLIASIEALVGNGILTAYCASKSGVLGLTRALCQRLGIDRVRVNAVCPGAVDTPLLAPLLAFPGVRERLEGQTPMGCIASPADIARSIRFLVSDEASFVTGSAFVIDGGMTAVGGV